MLNIKKIVVGALDVNCYIVWDSSLEAVIIDSGDNADLIIDFLTQNKLKVKYIVNTHGHADHIGANTEIKEFTGAKLLIHENDSKFLTDPAKNLSLYIGAPITSCKADGFIKENDLINFGNSFFKVIETLGHTMGSISLLLGDEHVFTGDTLFFNSIGRTDFPHSSDENMHQSLEKLKKIGMKNIKMKIYPGHGLETTMDYELKNNPYL